MTFQELVLHNVGIFSGRQVVNLEPSSPERPLILFGGLNGGGKTTILEALQLVLYGARFNGVRRSGQSYASYLEALIHKNADLKEGASLELLFKNTLAEDESVHRIIRTWAKKGKKIQEQIEVYTNDQYDAEMTDEWDERIESMLPHKLCNLFFFDGEQIEKLAEPEQTHDILSTAISSLLGLELVDQLVVDLSVTKTGRLKRQAPKKTQGELDGVIDELEEKKKVLESQENSRREIALILGRANNEFERATLLYRRQGGDLLEQLNELEAKKAKAESEVEGHREALRANASGALPLLLVRPELEELEKLASEEQELVTLKHAEPFIKAREQEILEWLERNNVDGSAREQLANFLRTNGPHGLNKPGNRPAIDLSFTGLSQLQALRDEVLPQAFGSAMETLENLEVTLDKTKTIERELARVPDKEGLVDILSRREKARHEISQKNQALELIEAEIQKTQSEIDRINKRRLEIEEEIQLGSLRDEFDKRFLQTTDTLSESLTEFKTMVLRRHLGRLEESILECYQRLLRKSSLINRISICPLKLELSLVDHSQKVVEPKTLSAGERQLLATAILWGLARCSGRNLPVVIDTPLGRLDGSHRDKLVQNYFPHASNQVLMLSTDEEVAGKYYEKLVPSISTEYEISYDETTGGSCIKNGYPFRSVAA